MKPPESAKYLLFGGTFVLANKLQFVGDKLVDGLSTKQWFLLRNLMEMPEEPPPTITQVAQAMDTTRQNITKMLEVMAREGLVTLKGSESDHRSRSVCITALGREYGQRTAKNAQGFLARLYEGIHQDELDVAGEVLKKMVQNLQGMQEGLEE